MGQNGEAGAERIGVSSTELQRRLIADELFWYGGHDPTDGFKDRANHATHYGRAADNTSSVTDTDAAFTIRAIPMGDSWELVIEDGKS